MPEANELYSVKWNFENIVTYCSERQITIEQYAEEIKERFLELFKQHFK